MVCRLIVVVFRVHVTNVWLEEFPSGERLVVSWGHPEDEGQKKVCIPVYELMLWAYNLDAM